MGMLKAVLLSVGVLTLVVLGLVYARCLSWVGADSRVEPPDSL